MLNMSGIFSVSAFSCIRSGKELKQGNQANCYELVLSYPVSFAVFPHIAHSSALKMEAAGASETTVCIYKSM
jgi:hypothetical protein